MQIFEVLDNCIDEVQGGHATNVEVGKTLHITVHLERHTVQACAGLADFELELWPQAANASHWCLAGPLH